MHVGQDFKTRYYGVSR